MADHPDEELPADVELDEDGLELLRLSRLTSAQWSEIEEIAAAYYRSGMFGRNPTRCILKAFAEWTEDRNVVLTDAGATILH